MTIPGVDYPTALLFISKIGDISRFPGANKLAGWLDLVPKLGESGEKAAREE